MQHPLSPHSLPSVSLRGAELVFFQETVAVDFYIYCHYICCLAVTWGCWVIACCLEGLYTICLILTPLQLINIQVLCLCLHFFIFNFWLCAGPVSCHLWARRCFLLETLLPHKVQHVSVCLRKHIWPWASEVSDVGGKGEPTRNKMCKLCKDTNMLRSCLQKNLKGLLVNERLYCCKASL